MIKSIFIQSFNNPGRKVSKINPNGVYVSDDDKRLIITVKGDVTETFLSIKKEIVD